MPVTSYEPSTDNETIILKVGEDAKFNQIYTTSGLGNTNNNPDDYQIWYRGIEIYGSNDLMSWTSLATLDNNDFYKWTVSEVETGYYPYIKIVFPSEHSILTEIGVKMDDVDTFLPLSVYGQSHFDNAYPVYYLFDENDLIPTDITYQDETYFDEIYHARNALEINQDQYLYAHVHPLLGTTLISLGISLFGINTFGFRFMGALFSVLLIPLFYLLIKKLWNNDYLSIVGTSLLAFDFMHYTTGRIATLEPFSIFFITAMYYFMICYVKEDFYRYKNKKKYLYLSLSAIMMACSWATKWTGLYASVGLALIFFIHLFKQYRRSFKSVNHKKIFTYQTIRLVAWNIIWFIIIPVVFYFLIYTIPMIYRESYSGVWDFISKIIDYTLGIFSYHSHLESTHPFESTWIQWLFNIRPIWYYFKSVEDGIYTISCFNNPLISWLGIISMLYTIFHAIKKRTMASIIIVMGYLSSLLPWIFIGRCLFSYHYYPSYPFLILSIVYFFNELIKKDLRYKKIITGFCILCGILFILFLPVIGGFKTDMTYVNAFLRWFETWYFGH
ncbi:MAG: phospholipid carrier-dependent glycosyltransferase [Erysipelotrichaceae bacterium]